MYTCVCNCVHTGSVCTAVNVCSNVCMCVHVTVLCYASVSVHVTSLCICACNCIMLCKCQCACNFTLCTCIMCVVHFCRWHSWWVGWITIALRLANWYIVRSYYGHLYGIRYPITCFIELLVDKQGYDSSLHHLTTTPPCEMFTQLHKYVDHYLLNNIILLY